MGSLRRLPPDRAHGTEGQLRARGELIRSDSTPLGICRMCAKVVYTGDALAMAGGYLLHDECCASRRPPAQAPRGARTPSSRA